MNALPETLLIGTVIYRVTTDPDEWLRHEHQVQRRGDYGYSQHGAALILINPESPTDVQRLSLWHEVLHCLDETVMGNPDWRYLPGAPEDADEAEERVVRMLEHPTLAVLRDNPGLVAYLTDPT